MSSGRTRRRSGTSEGSGTAGGDVSTPRIRSGRQRKSSSPTSSRPIRRGSGLKEVISGSIQSQVEHSKRPISREGGVVRDVLRDLAIDRNDGSSDFPAIGDYGFGHELPVNPRLITNFADIELVRIPVTVYPVMRADTLEDDVIVAEVSDKVAVQARAEFERQVVKAREMRRN